MTQAAAQSEHPFSQKSGDVNALREALYETMWNDVGILRTEQGLQRAQSDLRGIAQALERTGTADGSRAFNVSWHDWLNLKSLVAVSDTIVLAALARQDSRGAHFREDHPDTHDLDHSTYTVVSQANGQLNLSTAPVAFTRVRPGETLLTA